MRRFALVCSGLISIACLLSVPGTLAGSVQLREDPIWDHEISLDLKDAEIRQVFVLAFQIAGQPVIIDECVQGKVTLEFQNVRLRDALTSFSRMGNLRVRPRSEGYYVGCIDSGSEATGDAAGRQGHRLDFTLRDVTADEVIAQPILRVLPNSLAEIEVGGVETEDLDDTGQFYMAEPRSSFRVKAYLEIDDDGREPDLLRGVVEMASIDGVDRRLLRAAATGFEIVLPAGSTDVTLAEIELGGSHYALTVTRPAR